jgi:hypothetical protein
MARGSSYGEKPTEPSPTATSSTKIPRRTTRVVEAISSEKNEMETQGKRAQKAVSTSVLPDFSEQDTQLTSPTSGSFKASPARIPPVMHDFSEPHPLERHHPWLKRLLLSFGIVLIGLIVLATAGVYWRGSANPQLVNYNGQTFSIQVGGSSDAFNLWNNSAGPIPSRTALPSNPGPYSVLGKPTMTADFINQVLASYDSPTKGMGQSLYDLGVQYGIDPVYAMAFFMHESLFGKTGEARVTLSLGNERCIPDRPCIDQDRGGYAQMQSWEDGFVHWYKLIRNLYVAQWGLVTVDQIIPKYAPNSDGNDEAEYIATLKHEVDTWRAGILRP